MTDASAITDPAAAQEQADEDRDARGSRGGWVRYMLIKAGGAAVSTIMVIVLGFFAFRILPGDPAKSITSGRQVTPAQLRVIRHQYGLDQSILVQFWKYLTDMLRGNLGTSYVYHEPVTQLIGERVGPTLLLTGTSALLSLVLGLWLGQKAAWKRDTPFDRLHTGTALVFWSVPTFWLGLMLIFVFSGTLHWFPSGGMVTVDGPTGGFALVLDVAKHMVLPVLSMTAVSYAQYLVIMRSSLLEELNADYLLVARAKGLREDDVRRHHAIPNALLPTITMIFLTLGGLIGGAVTVETVFSWPGLGYLTYQALSAPDFPVLQGTFVVFSEIVIVMNFLSEGVYRIIDPRLR
ncbi:MAG: ABC transporter permease [Bifidobacterium sp.]|nr:ABC transporter permease [Bifidobacterium sp.]MCI1864982.1 ABC transporter permease [Bifidobacterium sp.]